MERPVPVRVANGDIDYAQGSGILRLGIHNLFAEAKSIVLPNTTHLILSVTLFEKMGVKLSLDVTKGKPYPATIKQMASAT